MPCLESCLHTGSSLQSNTHDQNSHLGNAPFGRTLHKTWHHRCTYPSSTRHFDCSPLDTLACHTSVPASQQHTSRSPQMNCRCHWNRSLRSMSRPSPSRHEHPQLPWFHRAACPRFWQSCFRATVMHDGERGAGHVGCARTHPQQESPEPRDQLAKASAGRQHLRMLQLLIMLLLQT